MSTFTVSDHVSGIDLEWFDSNAMAAYVIAAPEPTLIETGFPTSIQRLRRGLRNVGVPPDTLEHAFISHVHLDHSGGASALVTDAPDLSVYIHESTANHLVDPTTLVESSQRAMEDHFSTIGEPGPLPESNLEPVPSRGVTVDIGDRDLEVIHTPGHSHDHISLWEPARNRVWANEAIGLYFPTPNRWAPPATLPQFDPTAVHESIEKLRALDPDDLILSHFGARPDPEQAFDAAAARLDEFNERIPALFDSFDGDIDRVKEVVETDLLALDGCSSELVSFETMLQTGGFLKYHDRV